MCWCELGDMEGLLFFQPDEQRRSKVKEKDGKDP